jgi:hypothetical protein
VSFGTPTGLQKIADVLLHDLIPLLYVAFWFFFVPKSNLRWVHAIWWLVYPFIYLVYTLIRGSITGTYPYPFLDVSAIGYSRLAANALVLMMVFLGIGVAIIGAVRRLALMAKKS